ncbi:MAG: triphosphoribosyl-dephospho-CoA synthase [bacterium]|jgi:triphosphoribosyl-dephospho-CoA synthase|nr:MAG: triphosphoribosyl-dephospho-CoA synthetase [bacterium]HLV73298.1 triphosphoribosyl-dephospho-CoA synthase [Vulgatibacteraceae bacterium]
MGFRSDIAVAAQIACLLEASAPKPGNVNRYHDFADTTFEDFLLSAAAVGPAMGRAGGVGVGRTILRAVRDTRRFVRTNTNLGIILLLAPLARAAAGAGGSLRSRLARVLAELDVEDARAAYAAIRLAQPAGLGRVQDQDVREEPTVSLREAMALAAPRDTIAREYVTDYAVTFETGVPALCRAREQGLDWAAAVTETYLSLLAAVPDTLIARKCGEEAAREVSREAARVLAAGEPDSVERREALARFDASLRREGNALNPGTTADLTAATLFVHFLEQSPGAARPTHGGPRWPRTESS